MKLNKKVSRDLEQITEKNQKSLPLAFRAKDTYRGLTAMKAQLKKIIVYFFEMKLTKYENRKQSSVFIPGVACQHLAGKI